MKVYTVSSRRFLHVLGALAAISSSSFLSGTFAADADPLRQIKPGEWYEVPNSQLDAVAASEKQFPWLRGGIYGITACWAGGAFDSQRDRLYVGPGGGHAGYNGNEIYAFDLNDLKWHRLNDPDPVIPNTEYTDLDKAPFAMHTYDGVEYLPPPFDRYVVIGGWGTPRTYALDPDHPDHWEVYADHGTGRTGDICAYDPILNLLYLSTPTTAGKVSQWDPFTHLWTLRAKDSPDTSYYETADIDIKRRLMVSCGRGMLKTWSITPIPGPTAFQEVKTTGGDELIAHPSPGFCYAPLLDRFVAWGDGADVYTLDMDAKQWTKHPPAPTNTVIPGPRDQWGTFGRFRYVPSKNLFVLYNAVKQNVFIYRLTADQPNVITGVEVKAARPTIETDIPAKAIAVHAVYADGTRRDVTERAYFQSLDPAMAMCATHGAGVVTGLSTGNARIRATYTDPNFKRGFAAEATLQVKDIGAAATLDSLVADERQITIVAGDTFQLEATGSYSRGADHFTRRGRQEITWSSDAPETASVSNGLVKGIVAGKHAKITATCRGKSDAVEVNVVDAPLIKRIRFQVKDSPFRDGWSTDNGQPFTGARGYGWIKPTDLATRDDRMNSKNPLLQGFVLAKEMAFKVSVPAGRYQVRIAMGDNVYGAVPFELWTALGTEKLVYFEGQHNSIATRVVSAGEDGLVFTVKGQINYLIIAPVGIDLEKHADDGLPPPPNAH